MSEPRAPRPGARRRLLRVGAVVAAVLVLALVAVVVVGLGVVRRPLPEHTGTVELAGLSAEVTVQRDDRGVPTITASTATDLFAAQGYVDAQDRFFLMDWRRHVASGRVAELIGADGLASDRLVRTLGWRRVAEREWPLLDAQTRSWLQAYADGVNAYLDGREPADIAVEYTLLGLSGDVTPPERWTPLDSLTWLKAVAWDLRGNDALEAARAQSYATVRDVARVDELFPGTMAGTEVLAGAAPTATTATTSADWQLSADLVAALGDAADALAAVPHLVGAGDGTGSGSWVVAGEHTASGSALLAVDPHLSLAAPGAWSQVALTCAELTEDCPVQVTGAGLAGFPGVIDGRTPEVAWGMTSTGADAADLFLERTRRDEGTYLYSGEQVPLAVRTETIEVAGGDPVELEVRATLHGPLVGGVLDLDRVASAPAPSGAFGVPEVALGWTALQPGRTAQGLLALTTVRDAEDLRAAVALIEAPSQGVVFATAEGQIGYQSSGLLPVRARISGEVPSDGSWPRPGWDPRYDWQGYLAADQLPAVTDPATGYLVAANQAIMPAGTGPQLGTDADAGYRAQRIRDQLARQVAAGDPITVADTLALQSDVWSPLATALVPALLDAPVTDGFTREAVDLLRDWDGTEEVDSPAAAYVAAVWADLLQATFADDLPQQQWPTGGSRWLAVVVRLLDEPNDPWWDDRTTVTVVESRDEILVRSLTDARLELTVALGKDPQDWTWGRLHVAQPRHPLSARVDPVLRRLLDPSPVAVAGGQLTVSAQAWDAASGSFAVTTAPSVRLVADLGGDDSVWVAGTGTSGHPGSVHYTDQIDAWAQGTAYPWPAAAADVADQSVAELTLRPSAG